MLCQSTLAEYREGTLSPSRFGVWTSSVLPIKDFWMNRRGWWHGGLTPPWETAQSRSIWKDVASHFLQWTFVKGFPISIVWQEFDPNLGLVLSLSSTSRGHPCMAPWFLTSFPNTTAAFITSPELTSWNIFPSQILPLQGYRHREEVSQCQMR